MDEPSNIAVLADLVRPLHQMLQTPEHMGLISFKTALMQQMEKLYKELHTYEWLKESVK